MRRKNRRVNKKMSVNVAIGTHFGAIIAVLFVMVIVNVLASSNCQQIMKRIGEQERELARLEDARNREATRWEQMKTPYKVEKALLAHGLSMKPPRVDQNVHIDTNGRLYPGQLSVARAKERSTNTGVASVKPTRSSKRGR